MNILLRDFIRQTCLQKPEDIRQFAASKFYIYYVISIYSFYQGYFTHPMLEKRIENLITEHNEAINSDIKVISEEIFQR